MKKLSGMFAISWTKQAFLIFLLMIVLLSTSGCTQFAQMLARPYKRIAEWIDKRNQERIEEYRYKQTSEAAYLAYMQTSEAKNENDTRQAAPGKAPVSGSTWQCRDVAGEISALESSSEVETYGIKGLKLISAVLNLSFTLKDTEHLDLNYSLKAQRDEADIDAETETIKAWNHVSWTKQGSTSALLSTNGVFANVMEVNMAQNWTYPTAGNTESKGPQAFFGLIPPTGFQLAYLCDRGASPIPDGLESLTSENFRNYCTPGYYYECELK